MGKGRGKGGDDEEKCAMCGCFGL
eukprot:SAG11_NODE_9458_length_910_cov_0.758323_1_plen_23_part_01